MTTRLHELTDSITRDNARATGREVNLPAAFYAWTGTIPMNVSPGDINTAIRVVRMLCYARAMCRGDFALTRNEHTRLGGLITKWEKRAQGKDVRFNIMGTRSGRPNSEQQSRMEKFGWTSSHEPVKSLKVYNKQCSECGGDFESHRKDKQYCQPLCRGRQFERLKRRQGLMELKRPCT